MGSLTNMQFPAFLERAFAQRLRSTAIQPIQWVLGLLLAAVVSGPKLGAPGWLVVLLATLAAATALFFGVCYVYFMRKNPDALRSERYTLQKMALERGILGDSTTGPLTPEDVEAQPLRATASERRLESGP